MGLKESLKKLQEQENLDVRKEVRKELTKMKKERILEQKCSHCLTEKAKYFIKGSSEGYCKGCAIELFGELNYLKKHVQQRPKNGKIKNIEIYENRIIASFVKDNTFYKRFSIVLGDAGIDKRPVNFSTKNHSGTDLKKQSDFWENLRENGADIVIVYGNKIITVIIDDSTDNIIKISESIKKNF
jgi:hypothetical protein